ncbi:MAG TPA: GPW/gp25 family protein [Longimicrobiaceae bacterium]|nr:GPW/gp25 family protein [Longimicrobiaceae bacterium]
MEIAFPLRISHQGTLASVGYEQHVMQLIEQLLFTSPGERVNRPDFGCGILELVFDSAGEAVSSATQFLVQSALQQWLGDLILVEGVHVVTQESTLTVTIHYLLRRTGERHAAHFQRSAP